MIWFWFVVMSLAVYRLTRFWIKDTLIDGSRIWMRAKLQSKLTPARMKIEELLFCPHCISGHLSWIVVVVTMQWVSIPLPGLAWLAIWGVHEWLWRWVEQPIELHVGMTNVVKHREAKFE